VHWGIGVSIVLSVIAAWLFQQASNQALWEGVLALVAAVLVTTLIVHMWRHAKRMKREIETRLESSALQTGAKAFAGVFLFTLLMITREGMETALLMGTLLFQEAGVNILAGAVLGTICAAFVAWLWSRYGHRVNLALFFQVTAVFLGVFVVQLLIYGLHELTEANLFPGSEALHWATEPYGPDGRYGQFLSYMLLALPVGWLVIAALFGSRKAAGNTSGLEQPAAR
jgi:high-affinity iron transporter